MKSKTKKILAGVCLGVVGMGALTGCAMSADQKAALDLITEKSDEIVNLLEDNLEFNNEKISKESALDMLKHARIKSQYILNESNICDLTVTVEDGLYQSPTWEMKGVFDFSTDTKKMMVVMKEGDDVVDFSVANCNMKDASASYAATYIDGQPVLSELGDGWYASNIYPYIDALAQAGIQNIELEDITRVSVNEDGEYTFNIIKTTIVNKGEDEFYQVVNIVKVVVKDFLFKSVKVQSIVETGNEADFDKDIDGNRIEDGYGSYLFDGNITSLTNMSTEYKYGSDVSLEELNSRIADINAKIESGELTISE